MTPRLAETRREDPSNAARYLQKADELRRSGRANLADRRWNAACFDAIRAGMNAGDAVLVGLHGIRSISPRHTDILELLRQKLGATAGTALLLLTRLLAKKHTVEYESRLATEREAVDAVDRADELYTWAARLVKPQPL